MWYCCWNPLHCICALVALTLLPETSVKVDSYPMSESLIKTLYFPVSMWLLSDNSFPMSWWNKCNIKDISNWPSFSLLTFFVGGGAFFAVYDQVKKKKNRHKMRICALFTEARYKSLTPYGRRTCSVSGLETSDQGISLEVSSVPQSS